MKGRKTMIGLTFINPQYIQEAEFETVSGIPRAENRRRDT